MIGRFHSMNTTGFLSSLLNPRFSANLLGMNYAFPHDHGKGQNIYWLGTGFDFRLIDQDMAEMARIGFRRVRLWAPIDSLYVVDVVHFKESEAAVQDLHRLLDLADRYDMQAILVMGDAHSQVAPKPFDGKFRWDIIQSPAGIAAYQMAVERYMREFRRHSNILMWELHNEPYANLTWSAFPQLCGITDDHIHTFLRQIYLAAKELAGPTLVGISELEELQQEKYRMFSNPNRRASFVDDVSDVYSVHIYRSRVEQLSDLSGMVGKPKWCSELGSYNYVDETGESHCGQAANNELRQEEANFETVRALIPALIAMGFELIMPWSFTDNDGMILHQLDQTHKWKSLSTWMHRQLRYPGAVTAALDLLQGSVR